PGLAVVSEANLLGIYAVQPRNGRVHCVEIFRPIRRRDVLETRAPEDTPLHELHDVEPGPDHALVSAKAFDARHWKADLTKRTHHPRFAIDRMGAGRGHTRGFAPQNECPVADIQAIGRIRLTAL